MPYHVRPMHEEDVPQVNGIDREAFPTQWPPPNYRHELDNQFAHYLVACDKSQTLPSPEAGQPGRLSGLAVRLRRWFGDAERELALPDRHYIVGFAGIWLMADESHLTNIAVRQSYQRQGIGELLLISVIDLSARLKASLVTLEVRASNAAAQALYYKYGFTQTGLRRAYYTDNREDALLMSTGSLSSEAFQAQFQQLKRAHQQRWGAANLQLTADSPAPPERQ